MRIVWIAALGSLLGCSGASIQDSGNRFAKNNGQPSLGTSKVSVQSQPISSNSGNSDPAPNQGALDSQPPASGEEQKGEAESADVPDESVSVPSKISGTYVSCTFIAEPQDNDPLTSVGCRLVDAKGQRTAIASLAKEGVYSYEEPASSTASFLLRAPRSGERAYDTVLEVRGSDRAASLEGALNTRILIELKNLIAGGNGSLASLVSDVSTNTPTLVPPQDPAPSTSNNWVKTCRTGECEYQDKVTGLNWTANSGRSLNFADARAYCLNLAFSGSSNWVLPTPSQLVVARSDGISSNATFNGEMQINSGIFWTNEELANQLATSHDFDNPEATKASAALNTSTAVQVICVH